MHTSGLAARWPHRLLQGIELERLHHWLEYGPGDYNAAAGRMRKGGKEDEAQQKPPGFCRSRPFLRTQPTPEGERGGARIILTRLQARQRARFVRSTLQGAGSLEGHASASVGWLACDAVDALGVVSSTVPEVSLGAPCDVRFEQFGIDYPESRCCSTPLWATAPIDAAAWRWTNVPQASCARRLRPSRWPRAPRQTRQRRGSTRSAGSRSLPGRLFPLAESDSEDEGGDDHHLVGDSATSLT